MIPIPQQFKRFITQVIFLFVFIFIGAWPTFLSGGDHFFRWDFLTVGSAAISTGVFIASLYFSLGLVLVTLVFGRVFCGWVCPLGTLADFLDFIFQFETKGEQYQSLKYYLLIFIISVSIMGVSLAWILDPFTWSTRILGVFSSRYIDYLWFSILTISFIAIHFVFGRRAFCRIVCPLGAGLGVISKVSILERNLDEQTCTNCDLCVINNRSFAIGPRPKIYNTSECFQCRECESICPEGSISFSYSLRYKLSTLFSSKSRERRSHLIPMVEDKIIDAKEDAPNSLSLDRRSFLAEVISKTQYIATGLIAKKSYAGVAIVGAWSGGVLSNYKALAGNSPDLMRPPGAVIEQDFVNRCIRCNACFRACPTSTLVPSDFSRGWLEYGTPILDPSEGGCLYGCNDCGAACPTGAITDTPLEDKQVLKMGSAKVNENRCIPYVTGEPCTSCAAACPYEAISWMSGDVKLDWGDDLLYPVVNLDQCTGCGLCETACPVGTNDFMKGKEAAAIVIEAEYPRTHLKSKILNKTHDPVQYFKSLDPGLVDSKT